MIYVLMLVLMINFLAADSTTLLIDSPGLYFYGADIIANPTDPNDAIITVSADKVIIDLGDYLYTQTSTNQVGGLVGIRVLSPHRNIEIRGGRIDSLTGNGIEIQRGCGNIYIHDTNISNCAAGGLAANGIPSQRITSLRIEDCTVATCTGVGGGPAWGMGINSATVTRINRCIIGANDAVLTSSGYGLVVADCRSMGVNDCLFSANGGFQEAAGAWIQTSTQCFFRNCFFNLNLSRSSNANAFAAGAQVDYSNQCRFINCEMSGNTNPFARGHGVRFFQGSRNVIQNCILEGNVGGVRAFGAEFINEVKSECVDSYLRNNTSTNAWGIRLTGTCVNCYINNNEVVSNNGIMSSFGIQDLLDISTSVVTSNRAFDHIMNYTVSYPAGITLPKVLASLSDSGIGLPTNSGGLLDNVDIEP